MCLGVPGQIVAIVDPKAGLALVEISSVQREVNVECVLEPHETIDALVGEWVLVHVGFALSRVDAAEAEATLRLLQQLEESWEAGA